MYSFMKEKEEEEEDMRWYRQGLISRIDEWIYISDYFGACDHEKLLEYGIKRVISLGNEEEQEMYQNSRSENTQAKREELEYLNIVIEDSRSSDISQFFLETNIFIASSPGPVLIHCWAGISRSVTIAIAYYIKVRRMSYLSAFFKIQQVRPFIQPNPSFVDALFKLQDENAGII